MVERADIDALVEDAALQLGLVRETYQVTLQAQEVPRRLMARIKNVVENQRSALEYLAHQIYEEYGDGAGAKSYYPIANANTQFLGLFERNLPGVAANCPNVRDAIEARQWYQRGYEWLQHLVSLTNENKHRRLTPQTRSELEVSRWNRPSATIETDSRGNVRVSPPAGRSDLRFAGDLRDVPPDERMVYVDWLFDDPPLPALATLEAIQGGLSALVDDVLAALP